MKKLLVILFLSPLAGYAQEVPDSTFIRQISDDVLRNGRAYDLLRELTKKIGARLSGSPQFARAVQWGEQSMRTLKPDTVFLQSCMLPHWVRGGEDKAEVVAIGNKKQLRSLNVLALGNSLGSGSKGVTGQVLAVADFDELEQRRSEVKGKIVYYNAAFNPTNLRPGKSYGETGIYRRIGASRAAKYGAVAILIRSLTEATDNHPHTGVMAYNDSFPKIPAAALGNRDADYLWNVARQGAPVSVKLTTNGKLLPDTPGHNVIAELRPNTASNEYITIGGHLDSWDVNEGAHDDGTGVVQTMEVLRVFKALGYTPRHNIRFVLFANEENGSRGSAKYMEEAKARGEKHLFALESDAGGFTPRGFGFTAPADVLTKMQPWVELLKPYGVYELTAGGGGADIAPLNTAFGTVLAGFQPDGQRYFDLHHAKTDVFEAVNKRELLLGAINMAALIYLVDKHGL
ncbi:peptidase M28 family protein [Segetibacter sp. 3557_3]|uniref:M20/M25/M40 family metallo-hydrolase n=1 Tax=Segetibacter sp. 3557_3 TaxID=2547429 RepID=UPI001058DB55|nr:M20/M25/M40 family metallo-hydrolase [Segetibacter sp. 3557_3]TDH26553.1 peptidase M28 family protein [Segetibacter sp. 3557_3]